MATICAKSSYRAVATRCCWSPAADDEPVARKTAGFLVSVQLSQLGAGNRQKTRCAYQCEIAPWRPSLLVVSRPCSSATSESRRVTAARHWHRSATPYSAPAWNPTGSTRISPPGGMTNVLENSPRAGTALPLATKPWPVSAPIRPTTSTGSATTSSISARRPRRCPSCSQPAPSRQVRARNRHQRSLYEVLARIVAMARDRPTPPRAEVRALRLRGWTFRGPPRPPPR